ncbi:MAG: hypothetical protein VKO65_00055 [Cyanobacteriota bacterium]|nr:hypothetical protein [Cyanobacteriota bacterium]
MRDLRRVVPALLLIPGLMACSSAPPGSADPSAQAPPAAPPVVAPGAGAPVAGQAAAPAAPAAQPATAQANARGAAPTERASTPASSGLVSLPSARQVIDALPLGRRDPFASPFPTSPAPATTAQAVPPRYRNALPSALTGGTGAGSAAQATAGGATATGAGPDLRVRPAPLVPPEGFRVTGLIRAGRGNEAVVQFQELSGSLRRGDRGGLTTDLLPRGWSVASVDVNQGRLTLQRGRRQVMVDL